MSREEYWFNCFLNEREAHSMSLQRFEHIVEDLNNQIAALKAELRER